MMFSVPFARESGRNEEGIAIIFTSSTARRPSLSATSVTLLSAATAPLRIPYKPKNSTPATKSKSRIAVII